MSWPPDVTALKADMGITDDRDDDRLETVLAAVVAYVERVRGTSYNFSGDAESDLPDPPADVELGTLRLAGRYHARRRSVDGLVTAGEFGVTRIPYLDGDIRRLLGLARAVFA